MNTRLLRRIQRAILARPDQFDMSFWFQPDIYLGFESVPAGGCGTAACIAGWAVVLSRTKRIRDGIVKKTKEETVAISIGSHAMALTKITLAQSYGLFYASGWPKKFVVPYRNARTPIARAKVAISRIDYFIEYGK